MSRDSYYRVRLRRYILKWDLMLRNVKPSRKGFGARSVREDRESH